jgi:hypothetical protein
MLEEISLFSLLNYESQFGLREKESNYGTNKRVVEYESSADEWI